MLVDANLLLYAVNRAAPQHEPAERWLTAVLNGSQRVGLSWLTLGAFLRIATHPRVFPRPLAPAEAWGQVEAWLAAPAAWVPAPGHGHAAILGALVRRHGLAGNLVPDAQLAALAIEHGLTVCSNDADFARIPEVGWTNPLPPR